MNTLTIRKKIAQFIKLDEIKERVPFEILVTVDEAEYERHLISYQGNEGDEIKAYLLIPKGKGPFPAILVHHQHAGERHLGKSEIAGLAASPWQAFGPAFARMGIVIMAPDSICFEDRRFSSRGMQPDGELDYKQHYDEMCYRLLRGESLMKKVLDDAACAVSILQDHNLIDKNKIGILGHSYGGNTVLFQAALDERIAFACSSGAACSYRTKVRERTSIEMAMVITGFMNQFDLCDLVRCVAPRKIIIVSSEDDKFTRDADEIYSAAQKEFVNQGVADNCEHKRFPGGHPLTKERFEFIISWFGNKLQAAYDEAKEQD